MGSLDASSLQADFSHYSAARAWSANPDELVSAPSVGAMAPRSSERHGVPGVRLQQTRPDRDPDQDEDRTADKFAPPS